MDKPALKAKLIEHGLSPQTASIAAFGNNDMLLEMSLAILSARQEAAKDFSEHMIESFHHDHGCMCGPCRFTSQLLDKRAEVEALY